MTISPEMITAGAIAGDVTDEKAREIIEAALSSRPATGEGSRVEGLEWQDAKDRGYSQANCALGQYQVSWLGEFECWQCCRPHRSGLEWKDNFSRHASKDEAKAAAQADYEQRILSALRSPPEPVSGWQLVPKEATPEMFAAFEAAYMRKRYDMMSPSPTEEPDAGGGPCGYGYRAMLATAPQPPAQEGRDAEPVAVTDELVRYIARYGGSCRDCADEDGVCPTSGLPCGASDKAIRHVLKALNYGVSHGFLPASAIAHPSDGELVRKAEAFDQIVAARKAYVDAVDSYNARLEFVRSERKRGNWLNVDPEYTTSTEAQKAFWQITQELADAEARAALSAKEGQSHE